MAIVKPFKATLPTKDKVHLVASKSVDSYNSFELRYKLQTNPYTFLKIIKPEFNDARKSKPNSPELLKKIKQKYADFIKEGILVSDDNESFYVYEQLKEGHSYTGIIGLSSIDDYMQGVIKIHEQTITDREEKLMHYLEVCDFNAEPVLICHPENDKINDAIATTKNNLPHFDYTTTDKVRHKLWQIKDVQLIKNIEEGFKEIGAIYIADGHHRSASSTLLGKYRRIQNPNYNGNEAFNFFLCAYFSESQLHIYDFNRVVADLNNLYEIDFIKKVEEKFEVLEIGETAYKPSKLHNMSMYLGGKWYSLTLKPAFINDADPVGVLDAALLSEHILSPILGIHDLKTDKRVVFVNGTKGMEELKNHVDGGKMKVAFGLFPVVMQQLKKIADNNCIMPPKSTYIEPKLRSGMLVYSLSQN
ncbi:MAG TPA: DUF1015 family protein [Bacteroidia bacterium]|nr:DUF1015 family protein [Bacteroidia bacterium]